jgi:hypothetical protein
VVLGVRRGDLSAKRFAQLLVEACADASLEVSVCSLRRGEGPTVEDGAAQAESFLAAGARSYRGARVPADAHAIDTQLRAWASEAQPAAASAARFGGRPGVCVALGADFAARAQATAVIALTAGLPLVAFSPAARAVAPRFSLQLTEPRALVARGLVGRVRALL